SSPAAERAPARSKDRRRHIVWDRLACPNLSRPSLFSTWRNRRCCRGRPRPPSWRTCPSAMPENSVPAIGALRHERLPVRCRSFLLLTSLRLPLSPLLMIQQSQYPLGDDVALNL